MRRFLITSDIETLAHQYADEMEDTARFGKETLLRCVWESWRVI